MIFSEKTKTLIKDLYHGRDHLELTIGLLRSNGHIKTVHYDAHKKRSPEKLIYPVGSIGKPFTASLLAKEIAQGRISLEDSLDAYIPYLEEQYYPTILRLATHHSGYGSAPYSLPEMLIKLALMNTSKGILHVNPFRGHPDQAAMIDILTDTKLKDQDYKFEYSNFAYGVIGYILGLLDHSDYFTVMEAYVRELGLTDTSLQNSQMTGYDKKGNPCQPWQWEPTDIIAPAGALLSSMEDLLKFARLNMDGSHPYLSMCHEKLAEGEETFDQGLAWRVKKDSDISYHVGNAGAFSCILAMDRKSHQAVAIGLNYALVDIEEVAFSILEDLNATL